MLRCLVFFYNWLSYNVFRHVREYFTHIETSTLPVEACLAHAVLEPKKNVFIMPWLL